MNFILEVPLDERARTPSNRVQKFRFPLAHFANQMFISSRRAHQEDPASPGSEWRITMHGVEACAVQLCLPSTVGCLLLASQHLLVHLSFFPPILGRSYPTPLQPCPIRTQLLCPGTRSTVEKGRSWPTSIDDGVRRQSQKREASCRVEERKWDDDRRTGWTATARGRLRRRVRDDRGNVPGVQGVLLLVLLMPRNAWIDE